MFIILYSVVFLSLYWTLIDTDRVQCARVRVCQSVHGFKSVSVPECECQSKYDRVRV